MRIGVLTGGGDCPGLNAALRAIVRKGVVDHGDEFIGFLDAWSGVLEDRTIDLRIASLRGTLPRGGTVLGTRRGSPYDHPDGAERVREALHTHRLDALIVIGGNGSLSIASRLYDDLALPIVGVPKTIDNDVAGTDRCIGFDTAVQTATNAIDRLHTTAESHDRVMLVEVMGRNTGWIAAHAGLAGGATAILVPEHPFSLDELCGHLDRRHRNDHFSSIVVVAEGAEPVSGTMAMGERHFDEFGHVRLGGIATSIAHELDHRTDFEIRVTTLGHVQRGGTPTADDRVLAIRHGVAAIDAVHEGEFGSMINWQRNEIGTIPLCEVAGRTRRLDLALYDLARVFFG